MFTDNCGVFLKACRVFQMSVKVFVFFPFQTKYDTLLMASLSPKNIWSKMTAALRSPNPLLFLPYNSCSPFYHQSLPPVHLPPALAKVSAISSR